MIYEFDQLPKEVGELANKFLNISVGNKTFPCPYFMNKAKKFAHLSLSGKGTPDQIEKLTQQTASSYNFDLNSASAEEIRRFMISHEIGIDCSGLTAQLTETWLSATGKKPLINYVVKPKGIYQSLIFSLRFLSNISAEMLTSLSNCDKVELENIRAGDFLRAKGIPKGDHIMMITKVKKENEVIKQIEYIQSISKYGDKNGVRTGSIEVTDITKRLEVQKWTDLDTDGSNPSLEEYKWKINDNGIRRLKAFK